MNKQLENFVGRFPAVLIEALCLHDLLYNFGFSLETEIFLTLMNQDVFVVLKAQGKEVMMRIDSTDKPPEEILELWRETGRLWNTGGMLLDTDKTKLLERSKSYGMRIEIAAGLISQGFRMNPENARARTEQAIGKN